MFDSSLKRWGAIFVACLGATAAMGTAAALAATVPGENIFGTGSSLQSIPQLSIWTPKWYSTPTDHPTLSNNPTATYTLNWTGHAMDEFGNNTAVLDLTQDPTANNGATNGYGVPVLDGYVATGQPPVGPLYPTSGVTNLSQASLAATAYASTKIDEITVPVAQAPVAILISLPTGITAGTGSQLRLTNGLLQRIYDANVPASAHYTGNNWGSLLERAGWKVVTGTPAANQFTDAGGSTGGTQAITLQVRDTVAGTSYTIKGFLYLSGDRNYPACSDPSAPSCYANDLDQWPVPAVDTGNATEAAEVADTTASPGSIGYANLANAATATPAYTRSMTSTTTGGTHQIAYALVQSNHGGTGPSQYADPEARTPGAPNVYPGNSLNVNRSSPTFVGHWFVPMKGTIFDPTGSWFGTQASDPDVYDHSYPNVDYYPIVAVTYDLAWSDYDVAASNLVGDYGGSANQAIAAGNTVNSLLTYIVSPVKGQTDLVNDHLYYAKLPSRIDGYSVTAANKITP